MRKFSFKKSPLKIKGDFCGFLPQSIRMNHEKNENEGNNKKIRDMRTQALTKYLLYFKKTHCSFVYRWQ